MARPWGPPSAGDVVALAFVARWTMPTSDRPGETAADNADEVEELKREIARLREPRQRRGWWRSVVVTLLVTLAAVVAPLSVLATWSSGQISDTDRYLETVAPLASDPDVQDAIAARIEQTVFTYLDLDSDTKQLAESLEASRLPPRAAQTLQALSGPLADSARRFVRERIETVVRSDAFETAWVEANRTAHSELVAALTGKGGGAVQIDRGAVNVDLAILIGTVKGQLLDSGFAIADRIPDIDASFEIVQSDDLSRVQDLLGLLDGLSTWLPVVGLGALLAAVLVARDRRRTLLAAGLAVAGSMLLLGAALNVARTFYLDALPASSSAAAAGVIYDQIVSFIRVALRGVLVVALTLAAVMWLSASHGAGFSARRGLASGLGAARRNAVMERAHSGKVGVALAQYRGPLRIAIVGLAAVTYVMQDHPTGATAVATLLVMGVVLLVIELLAAPAPAEPEVTSAVA